MVKMSPWWSLRVWQKWIGAFVAWPALTAARFLPRFLFLMLESSAALCPHLGPNSTAHRSETNMEKNPGPSSSTKVPPRSSSTGPPPGESKPKAGENASLTTLCLFMAVIWCVDAAKRPVACSGLGVLLRLFISRNWRSCQNIWPTYSSWYRTFYYTVLMHHIWPMVDN